MIQKYATEKQICEALSAYKAEDVVTLLHAKKTNKGVIEAGTKMCILDVSLNFTATYSKTVMVNELEGYYATSDSEVFWYKCCPINESTGELEKNYCIACKYYEIELETADVDINEHFAYKTKKRSSVRRKRLLGCVLIWLALLLPFSGIFAASIYAFGWIKMIDVCAVLGTLSALIPTVVLFWVFRENGILLSYNGDIVSKPQNYTFGGYI